MIFKPLNHLIGKSFLQTLLIIPFVQITLHPLEQELITELPKKMKSSQRQAFTEYLCFLATEYQCTALRMRNYATTLETQLAAFDWKHLPKTVEVFPQMRRSLL